MNLTVTPACFSAVFMISDCLIGHACRHQGVHGRRHGDVELGRGRFNRVDGRVAGPDVHEEGSFCRSSESVCSSSANAVLLLEWPICRRTTES